jgi:hypothetical protein
VKSREDEDELPGKILPELNVQIHLILLSKLLGPLLWVPVPESATIIMLVMGVFIFGLAAGQA